MRRAACRIGRSFVARRDKFFAFFVAPSTPDSRGGSSGTCTRANYPSCPLKLRQNLLQRRIGAPRPPVLPVQQPGMPPSTAELVFKRRPRLESASLRYERAASPPRPLHPPVLRSLRRPARSHPLSSDIPIPPSASRWNVNSPPSPPPLLTVRRLLHLHRPPFPALCPGLSLAHSERGPASGAATEDRAKEARARAEENEGTGARKQIRNAGRRRIDTRRARAVEKGRDGRRERENWRDRGKQPEGRGT